MLAWSGLAQWICVILLFIANYQIASGRTLGWHLALLAATFIMAIDAPTQIIRTFISKSDSLDYLYGSLLSIRLLFVLLILKSKVVLACEDCEYNCKDKE